jgi:putative inorganic carbon (hco3(-)) transporter
MPAARASHVDGTPAGWKAVVCALALLLAGGLTLGFVADATLRLPLLVVGLAALGLAAATLPRPDLAVLAVVFVLFTGLSDVYGPQDGPLSLNQLAVGLLVLWMLLHRTSARRELLVRDRVLGWLLIYGAAIGLSALAAPDRSATLAELLGYLREVLIVFVLLNLVTTAARLRLASWTLVVAGVTLAGAAIFHVRTGYDFGGLSHLERYVVASGSAFRLEGPIGRDSNHFAQLLVTVVPLALYRARDERRLVVRLAALGAVVLMGVAIVWTFSRGGFLALLLVLGLSLVRQRLRPAWLLVLVLAFAPVVVVAPRVYRERVSTIVDSIVRAYREPDRARAEDSVWERLRLMQVGMLIFLDHPLTGIGRGNYYPAYPEYSRRVDPNLPDGPLGPHNVPIHIAAETGLVGLVTFGALVVAGVAGVRDARRRFAQAGLRREAMLAEAVELAIYGFLASAMFLNWNNSQRSLYILLALAAIARQLAERSVPRVGPATPASAPLAQPT